MRSCSSRQVGALVREGRPLPLERTEQGVGLGAHGGRFGPARHDDEVSAGVAAWPGRPWVRRSCFISASKTCRLPPISSSRAARSCSLEGGVVAVLELLDDLERPAPGEDVAPDEVGVDPVGEVVVTGVSQHLDGLARARGRPCRPCGGSRKSWPRASSTTSRASESFPTAATVASLVPVGRVWASSTDMRANLGADAVPRHPRDVPVGAVGGCLAVVVGDRRGRSGSGLWKTPRPRSAIPGRVSA